MPPQKYAIAHQVFLIDYEDIGVIAPLINTIREIQFDHFIETETPRLRKIRSHFANLLGNVVYSYDLSPLSESGIQILQVVEETLRNIQGSYFGMLQGRWPLHLLSFSPLPEELFRNTDIVKCRVYGYRSNRWSFSPIDRREGDPNWFRLEFKLPEEIANLVASSWDDPVQVADIKEEHFSYMYLSGKIGNVHRWVKLELDREWIQQYRQRMERRT